jgi:hypothetical protein
MGDRIPIIYAVDIVYQSFGNMYEITTRLRKPIVQIYRETEIDMPSSIMETVAFM